MGESEDGKGEAAEWGGGGSSEESRERVGCLQVLAARRSWGVWGRDQHGA